MQKSDGGQGPPFAFVDPADQPDKANLWFASQGDVNREVSLHKDPILKVKG